MDHFVYETEAKIEETHWWFVQRRSLFETLIKQHNVPLTARVVDVGTGTGANLRLLKSMGFQDVTGIDFSEEAAQWCRIKGLGEVKQGDIRKLPLADQSVDFVLATDVVEHVDEHEKAVSEILRILRPGGLALFTVPAFQSLWGLQDEVSHHYRRYRMKPFIDMISNIGFLVRKNFYFNYILFIPVFIARKIIDLLKIKLKSENEVNNKFMNSIFNFVFSLDVKSSPILKPPFGVSILVLAQRPHNNV